MTREFFPLMFAGLDSSCSAPGRGREAAAGAAMARDGRQVGLETAAAPRRLGIPGNKNLE